MVPVKIRCECGQPYAFEVEPVRGKMPSPVKCPSCGADGTAKANEIIARSFGLSTLPPGAVPEAAPVPGLSERERRAPPVEPFPLEPRPPGAQSPPRPPAGPSVVHFRPEDTVASNQGRMKVSWAKLMASYPDWFIVPGVFILAGLSGVLLGQGILVLPILAGIYFLYRALRPWSDKFYRGDVCAAVVVSERPWLVASATDMGADRSLTRPAVKILEAPLGRMTGGPPAVGTRLAAVALYRGPAVNGAWKDFFPTVINCAVADHADIDRVFHSILQADWDRLDNCLSQIPDPQPGLYRMWGERYGQRVPVRSNRRDWVRKAAWCAVAVAYVGLRPAATSFLWRFRGSKPGYVETAPLSARGDSTQRRPGFPAGSVATGGDVKPAVPEGMADPETVTIPDTAASGTLYGTAFTPDRGDLSGNVLTLVQTANNFPIARITIPNLPIRPGESLNGRRLAIIGTRPPNSPPVMLTRMRTGSRSDMVLQGYVLRLEFGDTVNGKLHGKIYLEMPKALGTKFSGTFTVDQR